MIYKNENYISQIPCEVASFERSKYNIFISILSFWLNILMKKTSYRYLKWTSYETTLSGVLS